MQRPINSMLFLKALLTLLCFFGGILFLNPDAIAATVTRSKGKKVEIEMTRSEDFVKGDKVYLLSNGKKVGIVRIARIKGRKALGKLLKGKAPKGAQVSMSAAAAPSKGNSDISEGKVPDLIVGVLGGFIMDSQTVKAAGTTGVTVETLSMSGSGFSGKAFADISLADELGLIGRVGVETFNVSATANTSICDGTTTCKTDIMYLSGDILARYNFAPGDFNPFIAGGLGIYYPISKSSNVLDEDKIAATTVFFVSGGANFRISNLFIPVQIEYGLFPPSNQVTTSFIAARAGVGFSF